MLTWTQGGLTDDESRALDSLTSLTSADSAFGLAIAAYPWVEDGITKHEAWALKYLDDLQSADAHLASSVASLPWVPDDITEFERWALSDIRTFGVRDVSLASSILGYPWISDGITEDERWALRFLKDIHTADAVLGERFATLPWIQDGITENEQWSVRYIKDIHERDRTLGSLVAGFPWVLDTITQEERNALQNLSALSSRDLDLTKKVARYPWLTDDITGPEWESLGFMVGFLDVDPVLANQLAVMPFFAASIEKHDRDALSSINNLQENHPLVLANLLEQDWYLDGLDDEEAGLVMIVGHRASSLLSPEDLQGFFVKHHAESRTATMPLAGEITLTFYQAAPDSKNGEIVDQVEDAIRVMEGLMGIPFPTKEVFLLMAAPGEINLDITIIGLYRGTHMLIDPTLARQGDNNRTINHEVAHYYWGSGNAPRWFAEGGADFLSTYIRERLYDDSMGGRLGYLDVRELRYCKNMGMGTIQKLVDDLERQGFAKHQRTPYAFCDYSEGENLFIRLFQIIGADAFSAAWADIYLIPGTEGRNPTEEEIYQAFLRHTPADKLAAFRETYQILHGGVFTQ